MYKIKKLIAAFNSDSWFNDIIDTNLVLESAWGKDYIVIRFDKNMSDKQCMGYVHDFEDKMTKRFYENKDDASIAFYHKSFPLDLGKGKLQRSKEYVKYMVPLDKHAIFNIECYLVSSFAKSIEKKLGKIFGVEYVDNSIGSVEFDRRHYLYCTYFENEEVKNKFIELFSSDVKRWYDNVPSDFFKIEGNCVYIKNIFRNNIPLIDSIIYSNFWVLGRELQASINEDKYVKAMKDKITDFIHVKLSIPVYNIFCAPYLGGKENSVLIPVVKDPNGVSRLLYQEEAKNINKIFDYTVLNNVDKCIPEEYLIDLLGKENYKSGVYGINFYDKKISCCIISKVIENSVVNKNHELAIPELQLSLPPKKKQRLPLSSSVDEDNGACAGLPKSMDFPLGEACTSQQPSKKKQRLPLSSSVDEDNGACAGLPKSMDFPLGEACTYQQPYGQPSSMIFENRLTQLTDQQTRFKDAQLPVRSPWSETQIGAAALGVGESVQKTKGRSLFKRAFNAAASTFTERSPSSSNPTSPISSPGSSKGYVDSKHISGSSNKSRKKHSGHLFYKGRLSRSASTESSSSEAYSKDSYDEALEYSRLAENSDIRSIVRDIENLNNRDMNLPLSNLTNLSLPENQWWLGVNNAPRIERK